MAAADTPRPLSDLAQRVDALRAELVRLERALAAAAAPTVRRPRLRLLRGGRRPATD